MKYIVEQEFIYGWENVWSDGETGEPTVYDTREEAPAELAAFLINETAAFEAGFIESPYSPDEFRITEVTK